MTPSTDDNVAPGTAPPFPNKSEYHYDLRLEISVKKEDETIPVVSIFHDLVQRMKKAADPDAIMVILTATDKLFFEHKDMSSEEFQKAFQVDETRGKVSKVLLGFKLRTTMKLSDIKKRLMHTFLIPNNMFLREHVGGFHYGVTSYTYGFMKDEHPDHPDILDSSQRILRICKDSWKEVDKEDKIKWREEFPSIYLGDNVPIIPIRFTKERITAIAEGKERIVTHALMISTPMKFGKMLKTLLSIAVLKKRITNLIPFALGREDPVGYYNLIAAQAQFMESHRNIPISNVPNDSIKHLGIQGKSLLQVLTGNNRIQRVAYDPKTKQYHVSTRSNFYRETHQWISKVLEQHKFGYHPEVKRMRFDYKTNENAASVYSDIFKEAISVAAETQGNTTIKTPQGNAWYQRPPLAISYVKVTEAFPPLPEKSPATQSTASETLDEETIQSAISAAIKKLEKQHQVEITNLRQELRSELDAVKEQMKDMAKLVATQTYQALTTSESPLATKAEFARLDHRQSIQETQLATIIELLKNKHDDHHGATRQPTLNSSPPRSSKRTKPTLTPIKKNLCTDIFSTQSTEETQPSPDFNMGTQSNDATSVSSATSDLIEDMEGCED